MAGLVADATNLETAILVICISAWLLCFVLYLGALFFVPGDIRGLRSQLTQRAEADRAARGAAPA
jgi:hypothetical protein